MKAEKKEIRNKLRAWRKSLSSDFRKEADQAICRNVLQMDFYASCSAVALYASDGWEPDLTEIARAGGKILLYPRYFEQKGVYEFAVISDLETQMVTGRYGLLEPAPDAPAADADLVQMATLHLVPGVAFDRQGRRLGRGGGFYDRLLEGVTSPVCGVFYAGQEVPEVPEEAHDRRLDLAVTELGRIDFSR